MRLIDFALIIKRMVANINLKPKEITRKSLASTIDHTSLKPETTKAQIKILCEEAIAHGFYAVCVNSSMVPICKDLLRNSKIQIVSVVGFPLGACDTSTKSFETNRAINLGATEIDMVLHLGLMKAKEYSLVDRDIQDVVRAAGGRPVKVILETSLLTDEEKKKACEIAISAGAHFIKTCTGFGGGSATVNDIHLIKSVVAGKCEIKASGGIRDFENAKKLIEAGASRIGTSLGVSLVSGTDSQTNASDGDY